MKSTFLLNKRVGKAAILVCLLVAFMALCFTGCETGETAQKSEPVTLDATATQAELQEKLADASVGGVILSGDISLTEPLQITDAKSITGAGTISAGEGFSGDYLITVDAKGELLLGGDVVLDAAGVAGGVHVAPNAVLTLQDQAAVKNASAEAANLLVEGFLDMLSGSVSNPQGHNIHNVGETNIVGGEIRGSGSGFAGIYNEGTLTQNGGTVARGYNNIVSAEGSEFTWNGGSNESAMNNGLIVAPKAKLTVTAREAKLTGAGNLGIELLGTAVIDDITLNNSFSTLIKVDSTGKLTLNGGMIFSGSLHGVDNAGVMIMNGGDIMSCAGCGIVNTGTLEIKAGGVSNHGNKGILNKLEGKATVVGADITISGNKFAIGNEDNAYFELAKAYIMGSTTTNIYALGGEMYIHDIELGASNSNNIRVVAADLKLKDVAVNGNASSGSQSMHGIILEGGSVHATDLIVRNTTGAGIRNKGGSFTGKNVTLDNNKYIGIYTSDQDVTGRAGTTVLENLTVSKQGYMSVSSNGNGVLEITNGVFEATPSNNIRVNGGTVKLNKVEVKGHTEEATTAHHGIYLEGGHIIANNLTITNTKGHGLRNKGGNVTGTNVIIKNVNGDAGVSNVMLANGASGVITLTNVAFSNVKSKNIVCETGVIKVNDSTLSPCPGSNIKITGGRVELKDVHVAGNQKVGTEALHAIIIENGKGTLTAKNVTISNAKNAGIRNKTGVVEATNLTIKDCGSSAISNGADTARGLKGITKVDGLTVENCGSNNIIAEAGEIHVSNAKLGPTESNNVKTSGTGLITLTDTVVGGSTGSYGVIAEGGSVVLTDVTIKDTKTAGIRVNKANGSVTGTDVTIEDTGTHAIYVNHGSVVIEGLTTKNIGTRNIEVGSNASTDKDGKEIPATGGTVVIKDGNLCKTENQHSVAIYGENAGTVVELSNVTLNGSGKGGGSRHVILAEGGNAKLLNVTIKDANNAAIRVNRTASTVEAENLTIKGGSHGISASAGTVTVKNLKSAAADRNIAAEGATITIDGAEFGATKLHNIKINKGSLALKDATMAGSSDRGIMIEPGASDGQPTVDLLNVKISDTKSCAIENRGGIVTAKDLTITGSEGNAVQNQLHKDGKTAGSVTVENYTVSDSARSVNNDAGTVTVVGGTFGVTSGHNVKATSGTVSLTNVTIGGTKADSGIMAEGGDVKLTKVTIQGAKVAGIRVNKAASTVTGTDVTIDGTGAQAIWVNNGGVVELTKLTTKNVGTRNIEAGNNAYTEDGKKVAASGGTVKITDGDLCKTEKQHNVVAYGENAGTLVELTNVTVNGSGNGGGSRHAILAEGGNVKLTDVTIQDASNAAIRVNKAASSVEGENLIVQGASYGISASAGSVTVKNLTSTASVDNILAEGATITVNGGTLNATGEKKDAAPHNVKATSGSVTLNNVTINGVTDSSAHVLMAEGGDMILTNVTVKGAKNTALRVNKAASEVTATTLTIEDAANGVYISNGSVTITDLTSSASRRNIEIDGGTLTVTGGALATTSAHNVKAVAGSLTLKNATIAGSSDRGIMVEPGASNGQPTVNLENVKISNTVYALDNMGGIVNAKDLTVSDNDRNINNVSGTVTVVGGTFGVTPGHNVKAGSGTVSLTNVTINGTTKDNGIMAEGGSFVLNNVTIKNAKNAAIRINKAASSVEGSGVIIEGVPYGISGSAGTVSIKELTSTAAISNILAEGASITVDGGTLNATGKKEATTPHNVKTTSGSVTLNNVTVNGVTDSSAHALMAEGGDMTLNSVTVKNAKNAALRVNKAASEVTATNLTIQNSNNGAVISAGEVEITGLTGNASSRNIDLSGGTITVNGGTLGITSAHNVKATAGTAELSDVTINGTTAGAHGIMAEGGDFTLTNVTVKGTAGNAIRANKAESAVTVNGLTVQGCAGGISASAGTITVDTMTASTTGIGVLAEGAAITVKNATLTTTGTANVVEHTGGTLNLENVSAATIYNTAADLNLSGKIVGSVTNDAAVAVNVTGALTADSAIVIDWTEGNGPSGTAISFADGTMATGQNCFTLGAVQSEIKKLVFENNTGRLENLYNYVAQVGVTKYEDLNEAIAALKQLTGDQTLIILADCGDESTTIEIPDGMNLTIQGGDYVARLGATVKVDANDTLTIGKNVTFNNVEVIVEGTPYEEVLTLVDGHSVTADMFSLKTASGEAYGAMIEDNKVMVYTKEASDEASMLAAVNGAPNNKRGYVIVTGDVTLSNTLTFSAGKLLTVMDDGNERTISRTNAAVDMIVVETGANITIKSSDNSARKLVLDGKSVGNNALAMVRVTGGTATINNVNIANANSNYNLFCSAGTLNVSSAELGSNLDVSSVYVTGGKVSLTDVEVKDAGSNSIRANGGEIALHNVIVNGHTRSATLHNINIDGGKVTATGTLTLKDSEASGIRISKGSFDGENATVTVNNMGASAINANGGTVTIGTLSVDTTTDVGIYVYGADAVVSVTNATLKNMGSKDAISAKAGSVTVGTLSVDTAGNAVITTGGTVTVTKGGTIKNVNRAVQVTNGTVSLTGMTIEKNKNSHNIKVENGGLNLSGVTVKGSKGRAIMVEPATKDYHPNVTLHNVTIEDADSHGLQNKGGIVTATGTLTINNSDYAILNAAHGNAESADHSGSVTVATLNATGNNRTIDSAIGTVTVNGGTFGKTPGHNVKATAGTITLKSVTINGTTSNNGIMAEGGNFVLTGVTIKDTAGRAIWMNKATSEVNATNLTITGCAKGVGASNGVMYIDIMTAQTTGYGIEATNGTITVKNATLTNNGTDSVVYHNGGTLNLENVTAATIYNSVANLNISGKIVGSITNDAAVAVNVTSALTDGSAVTVDWAEGKAPAAGAAAISFAEGAMDASKDYFTLGAVQSQLNNLVFADNAGKLVSKVFVAQVGAKKYETFDEAAAAISAENNTLIILENCTAANTIVVPEGANLTIQGGDKAVALNATVQVGAGETLTIGNNVKITKVDATAGGSITYAGNAATAAEPMTVVVKGQAHEIAVTLAEDNTATADMFTLVDASGNAYGSMLEDGKIKVYTKDVNTQEAMQAAIDAAPVNARGYIVITGDVTINSTVTFTANKLLTMQDDGNARKILRGDTTGTMLKVDAGAKLTIRSSAAAEKLTFDGGKLEGKKGSGMLNTQGELTMEYVGIVNNQWDNNNRGLGLYANAGSVVTLNNVRFDNISNTYKEVVDDKTKTANAPAMIVNGATVHMNYATIKNCTTFGSGAVEITGGGKLYANSSTFTSNQAAYGGAIFVNKDANTSLTVDGCLFESNHATGNGGAIQVDFNNDKVCAVTIKNSTFRNNSADGEGGAIGAATGGHLNISDTIFEGNTAAKFSSGEAATKVWGNDIRLGGATNVVTLSGKVKVCVFHNQIAVLKIAGNLTEGSDVRLDGRPIKYTAASHDVIEFANEAVMNASKGYISLGGNLTDADKYLVFEGTKGKLQNIPVVTTQAELEQALANAANIPVIKLAANTTISVENVTFPTIPVTIQGQTGSVLKYAGSTKDASMVSFPANANVTFQGVTFDGNSVGKLLIPADANVTLANSTVTNMKGCKDRSLHVQGNLNIRGTVTIDGANWGLGVNGSGVVTSETGSKLIIKNATYGITTHDTANVHIVELETTSVSNSALYNDGSSVMVVDKANLGATASGKHTVDVLKGTVTLSNATITNAGGNAVNQRAGSLTLSKVTITNPGGYGVIQNAGSLTMNDVLVQNAPGWSVCVNGDSAVMNATNLTVSGSKGTCLQIEKGTATVNNLVTTNVVSSHNVKLVTGTLNINGMNLGVSNSNCMYFDKGEVNFTGTCVISGNKGNHGLRVGADTTVNVGSGCTLTITNVKSKGICIVGGKVNLAGTVNATIAFESTGSNNRTLNITSALGAGSAINVDWLGDEDHPAGNAITFASAEVLNASKAMITLGGDRGAAYELSFGETTATLVAKQ